MRQHNSGAVEDFILPYSAVYLRIQKWKNYWNRSTFAKVIVKIKVARFYGPRCSFGDIGVRKGCNCKRYLKVTESRQQQLEDCYSTIEKGNDLEKMDLQPMAECI